MNTDTQIEEVFKWQIISYGYFKAEYKGYVVTTNSPYWYIEKGGIIVDHFAKHSPTKCELSTKIQAKKQLDNLINTQPPKQ